MKSLSEKEFVVDGFLFSTEKEYEDAKQELESVEYLRNNSDLSIGKTVLKLYNRLIEDHTFHTPIGYQFLKELQDNMINSGIVKVDELVKIYVPAQHRGESSELNALKLNQYKQIAETLKTRYRNSRIINIFLVIIIIVMIGISIYSDKTVFTKFENQVINKYASWEEELKSKNEKLITREEELNIKEEELSTLEEDLKGKE